jgi:SAM-dependent methyltransferase
MEKYHTIYKYYESCLDKHGDNNLGVDWPNKEDVDTRFKIMTDIVINKDINNKILDFGCGCGHLYEYILKNNLNITYSGLDISPKFYELCKTKFPNQKFYNIDILKDCSDSVKNVDYIVINGVFTEKRDLTDKDMWIFMTDSIKKLFQIAKIGIVFNLMTPIVDYKDDKLFYVSFDKLGFYLKENLSRNFIINNNYKLWEYSVYVYK